MEKGCKLLTDYSACIDSNSLNCSTLNNGQENRLQEFLSVRMYICELLVPSVMEHRGCFAVDRIQQCPALTNQHYTSDSSFVCSIVTSTIADIDCVESSHGNECEETAMEMIAPMRSETEHILSDHNCAASTPEAEIMTTTNAIFSTTNLFTSTLTSLPENIVPTIPTQEFAKDLHNVLFVLTNLDAVCQRHMNAKDSPDLWAPIRAKICHKKPELKSYGACFEETKAKSGACPNVNTSCGAIDSFNKNVDCIVKALNDFCPVEAQEIVIEIQEKLNDEAILHKCYQTDNTNHNSSSNGSNSEFTLTPTNSRCDSDQENAALVCLVELVEINRQLSQFKSVNFMLEVSNDNSTVINRICELYSRYEQCVQESVFARHENRRSPVCKKESRQILIQSRQCLISISNHTQATQCQTGLHNLGPIGVHGEALLCKSFYLLKKTFECGEKFIKEQCESNVYENLGKIRMHMAQIGMEEGCPSEEPKDLDAIIAKPVKATPPLARPVPVDQPQGGSCAEEEHKQFNTCVQPLTAFQPHPLAVIRQPKQIDAACAAFKSFNTCRATLKCNPLWAQGMSAMFEFACGSDGYTKYLNVNLF